MEAGEYLSQAMIRLFPTRLALNEHRQMVAVGRHVGAVGSRAVQQATYHVRSLCGALLVAKVRRVMTQERYCITQTLSKVVSTCSTQSALALWHAKSSAATVLLAAVAATLTRKYLAADQLQIQEARQTLAARLHAWRVYDREAHYKRQDAARLLQKAVGGALNRVAEAGVKYLVNFLWRRVQRCMMVQRLQRSLLCAIRLHAYTRLKHAATVLQACCTARAARLEHLVLTRGWRRRLLDENGWKTQRRSGEETSEYILRLAAREREMAWVRKVLEEEAVEETIDSVTGFVLHSRLLGADEFAEYRAMLGRQARAATPVVPLGADRRLVVEVIEAKRLKAMDRGGTSDPYVTLQVGGSTDQRKRGQTKVIKKNLNPVWKESLELVVSPQEVAAHILHVRVWDKDLIPGADDLIGHFSLPLSTIDTLGTAQWHPIYDQTQNQTGSIKATFCLAFLEAPLCLKVHAISAKDLTAMDRGGTSDPYLTLQIGNTQDNASKICRTNVVKKTLDPEWDETFQLLPSAHDVENGSVLLQVWDKDLFGDDLIGALSLPISSIARTDSNTVPLLQPPIHSQSSLNTCTPQWLTIYDNANQVAGKVQMVLELVPLDVPLKLSVRIFAAR